MDKLLEQLQHDNLITEDQARVFRIESVRSARTVRSVLADADLFSASTLDQYHGDTIGIELSVEDFIPDAQALELIEETIARRYNVLPLTFDAAVPVLVLALDDTSNLIIRDRLRREVPDGIQLVYRRSEAADIKRILDKCYGACHSLNGILLELEQQATTHQSHSEFDHAPVVRLIDAILQDAVTRRASDIHLSPEGLLVSIRYRIDGVLHTACSLHACYWPPMLVRIKVLSCIDIAETRLPQDGHVTRTIHGERIDFRVASFPIQGGENLVLRVLDRRRGIRTLSALCNDTKIQKMFSEMLARPHGLVLVCGPTGSGKTTTLYAMLQSLDATALNIMTLEDPIEYPMPNIRQTRVQGSAALDFADGVKGVLRQDPDVILIGEIRDEGSCVMACRAAMTGHLILSSTHADNCIGAINRLMELGAQRSVVANVLAGVVSQRLVRKVCSHCVCDQPACGVCGGAGYSGRLALFECLPISDKFSALLHKNEATDSLLQQARKDGMTSLADEGQQHVLRGNTSSDEIGRVLGFAEPAT